MSDVACHFLEQLPRIRRSLRRYSGDRKCPNGPFGYCNAEVPLDDIDYPVRAVIESFFIPHGDLRWPKGCPVCGVPFVDADTWQVFVDTLHRRSGTGEIVALRQAQPGDMWDAYWMPYTKNADGRCLVVKLPNGHDWMIDGPSQQHPEPGAWTRTGTPPNISASPSILAADYHGWLRNGVLSTV